MDSLKNKVLFGLSRLGVFFIVIFVIVLWWKYLPAEHDPTDISWQEIEEWLGDNNLSQYTKVLHSAGITNMEKVVKLTANLPASFAQLPPGVADKLQRAARNYQERAILKQWLLETGVQLDVESLREQNITSLAYLSMLTERDLQDLASWDSHLQECSRLLSGVQKLRDEYSSEFEEHLWKRSLAAGHQHMSVWLKLILLLAVMLPMYLFNMNYVNLITDPANVKRSLLEFVTGRYLAIQFCKVFWEWEDPQVVGKAVSFKIKFYQRNGHAYRITAQDKLLVEIIEDGHLESRVEASICLGGKRPADGNTASVVFTVRRAADYRIAIMVRAKHIRGSPFLKQFLPGDLHTGMTGFVNHVSTVVCTRAVSHQLLLEPRDRYGNLCMYDPLADNATNYQLCVTETGKEGGETLKPHLNIVYNKATKRIGFQFRIDQEGCYHAHATYGGVKLKNGDFTILVLNESETRAVEKVVAKKSHNVYYEAKLLSCTANETEVPKPKKVYCYISPKQLTIKEFYLRIFPRRLFTFRVCPSTKFQFLGFNNQFEAAMMTIDDGCQPSVLLALKDRNIVAASFSKYLVKNIGGSETFKDKQDFFYHEIRQLHSKRYHDRLVIKVTRHNILESSMKAMKHFSLSDWCKNFDIHFLGEEGLDWGGLRREWIELICTQLFDTASGLFVQFTDDPQSLVHPNAGHNRDLKLKYYEFAGRIVGKCLYESALGSTYRQLVKARFTRSFLAQLIGLRVNYRYFEQDDPELYISKIKYIEENDVDEMELVFAEEQFKDGKLEQVCELIPNGANVMVTNKNKLQYLDALAQHHLSTNVRNEIDSFLRGLNEFIPDNLLSIFDENELELLMCGSGDYSIADFKQNHVICGSTPEFLKVVNWFWTIVSGFTREEMARLLQFTTGCSQLPPAGFSELSPKLQITAVPVFERLPTAHTCFNQLCLPDYESLESMHRALLTAINEGYQGFSMA